ncbi:MAG: amidohydrolase [Eubacteriales bacterium]|nr:amidohydrolase [Eubacteriales bacterium]
MKKVILIIGGKCLSMVGATKYDWIALSDGYISDLGYGDGFKKYLDKAVKVIDAKDGTVLPGFVDSHFHVVQAALNSRSLDLSYARSFRDIGELIIEAAKASPKKPIRGIRLDEQNLKENRMPDRAILDKYCKDAPVFLNSVEYQTSVLNTYALLYYKIPFTLDGIDFDENQMPTGIITHYANVILRENVLKAIPSVSRMEAVTEFLKAIGEKGITTVNAMEGGRLYCDKDAEFIYEYADQLLIDMALFYQTMDIQKVKEMKLKRIGGSLYIDGTFGARTSALSFEYYDCPGNKGGLNFTQEELNEFVLDCYINKLQLALYTIGDRAIEQAITAHEYALNKTGNTGLRHRLEHVELPTTDHIKRARELGLVFSVTPTYEYIWGGPNKLYQERLGENYKKTNPFNEIVKEGVIICGGSDCDVTPPDPLLGIHSAVNHPVEKHRVSIYDAVKMFTSNGAYGIFEEDKKGTLEIGKLADIVILDRDILSESKEKIKDIKVNYTIKSGQIIFKR